MSPTQRTLAWLKEQGFLPWIVEKWNPYAKVRIDMYGWIDIVAIRKGEIVGIQCTSSGVASRVAKAQALPSLESWKGAGAKAWVMGWTKKGPRGKRKVWTHRIVEL